MRPVASHETSTYGCPFGQRLWVAFFLVNAAAAAFVLVPVVTPNASQANRKRFEGAPPFQPAPGQGSNSLPALFLLGAVLALLLYMVVRSLRIGVTLTADRLISRQIVQQQEIPWTAIRCLSTLQMGTGAEAMVFVETHGAQGRVVRLPVRSQDRQEVVTRVGAAAARAGASVDVGFDLTLLYNFIHGLTPDGTGPVGDGRPAWTAVQMARISPRAGPPAPTGSPPHVSSPER